MFEVLVFKGLKSDQPTAKPTILIVLWLFQAIGEPPLFLAASVFFAFRHAIAAARADVGLNNFFQLNSPATAEKIRMACVDQFTKQVQ